MGYKPLSFAGDMGKSHYEYAGNGSYYWYYAGREKKDQWLYTHRDSIIRMSKIQRDHNRELVKTLMGLDL